MKSKLCCSLWPAEGVIKVIAEPLFSPAILFMCWAFVPVPARAADAPQWMHALVNAPLPPHDEKTDAVLLYYEEILNVQSNGRSRRLKGGRTRFCGPAD